MNRKVVISFLFQFTIIGIIQGQHSLPISMDMQQAYERGTRSYDGKPGPNYWQNRAEYQMSVYFDPVAKTISGHQKVVYTNNSPDTMNNMIIRLYQDLYKKGNARDFSVAPSDLHDGVNIDNIRVYGIPINPDSATRTGTHLILPLRPRLMPGKTVEIEMAWSYPISQTTTIREGYYRNHNGYFIAYWYPQIAVYDDVWGWNRFSYTGMQEFYNDFNNYHVEVSAPKGYLIWATGVLKNPENNLAPAILAKYLDAQKSDHILSIVDTEDYERGLVTVDKDTVTWVYTAENVTDFAFAASNHYLWQASTVNLSNHSVLVSSAFDRSSKDFYEVADVARKSIEYFSKEMPGVEYPYPSMTVFNGKGGMEFPMMVNDGSMPDRAAMVFVTTHEIAHTYFPFYTGINEQMFAFMDEGWAMMLPFELQRRLEPSSDPVGRTVRMYEYSAASAMESQLMLPSIALSGHVYSQAYRNSAYSKSGLAYFYLKEVLGEEKFKNALHEYINRWKGKHPLPYDFFYTFNEVAGEGLSWFWKPWFFETGHPDLSIHSVVSEHNNHNILIENLGTIPTPIQLQISFADGSSESVNRSARVWESSAGTYKISIKGRKRIKSVTLGNTTIPDVVKSNNYWTIGETEREIGLKKE